MTLPTQDGYDWPAGCSDERWPVGEDEARMAALEREHFGDPDKKTGIYAERVEAS